MRAEVDVSASAWNALAMISEGLGRFNWSGEAGSTAAMQTAGFGDASPSGIGARVGEASDRVGFKGETAETAKHPPRSSLS